MAECCGLGSLIHGVAGGEIEAFLGPARLAVDIAIGPDG
jgi:hypothetical protein